MHTGNAARDLISTLEQPFGELRTRYKTLHNVVFNRYDYKKDLSSDLGDSRKSFGASLLRRYKDMGKASLRNQLSLHLEPVRGSKGDAADRMELMQAHDLLLLDRQNHHRDNIHHFQVIGPFWAGWLDFVDYKEPEQRKNELSSEWTKRAKAARLAHYSFRLLDKDPKSVSYMESNRQLTLAGCRVKIPYIDLLERYGESYNATRDNPEAMMRICNEHFPFIRNDEGVAPDFSDTTFWGSEAEVCIVADKSHVWHYIDLGARDTKGRFKSQEGKYESLGEGEYENSFGDVPLVIAEGVYNPHQPLQYRREGMFHSLIEIEHGKAFYKSFWASVTAAPQRLYADPPDAVRIHMLENPTDVPPDYEFKVDERGIPKIGSPIGALKVVPRELDAMSDKLYGILNDEAQIAGVGGVMFDPEAGQRMQNIPVSSLIAQQDALSDLLGEAQRSETNMWNRALDMLMHARKNKLNSHREPGDKQSDSDWGYGFRTLGEEKVKGKRVDAGQDVEVKASDYDGEYVRSIEPLDNRASTRAAQRAEAQAAWMQGTMTYDKYLEAYGIENVTEFKQTKYLETMFQLEAPRQAMEIRAAVAQFTAVLNGSTIEEQLMGLPAELGTQMAGAFSQQQGLGTGSNVNLVQVASPQMERIGADSTSQQPA